MASLLSDAPPFAVGAPVQVFCRFDGRWVSGFVVSGLVTQPAPRVRVTRRSDGSELPEAFALADVRADARAGVRYAVRSP